MELTNEEKKIICKALTLLAYDGDDFLACLPNDPSEEFKAQNEIKICEKLHQQLSNKRIFVRND